MTQSKEDDGKIPARQQSSATHTLSLTYVNPAARVHETRRIEREKRIFQEDHETTSNFKLIICYFANVHLSHQYYCEISSAVFPVFPFIHVIVVHFTSLVND